ncbi:hypothetical protein ACI2UK_13455 [Ralstonia nicotianae]|uniref:hypothetical protein n=1 Tax=Ralstonia pseudosolanacearum TaxID=1310165 RepID=UPI002004FBBB|nr:hypothetical protein [Ralstonia pseudosolanacearum]MCK4118449.1 hypothetical protein [Ralstonia pseudosolanacearum]
MLQIAWLSSAAAVALSIVLDMSRLRTNRVGLPAVCWIVVCACVGPLAGAAYLLRRRVVQRELMEAASELIGDASHPAQMRRERLIALERAGVLGAAICRACLAALEEEHEQQARNTTEDA